MAGPNGTGSRRIFTYMQNSIPSSGVNFSSQNQYQLHEDNNDITESDLGISSGSGTSVERAERRTQLLKWARGVDVSDDNLNGDIDEVRTHIGDPMHASPLILNYENGRSIKEI